MGTNNNGAYDWWLKGRAIFLDAREESTEGNEEARRCFEEAVNLAPNFALAHGKLSYTYVRNWEIGSEAVDQQLASALECAETAVRLGSDNHWNLAIVYSSMGRYDEAMTQYEMARKLDPINYHMLAEMGFFLVQLDRCEEAIAQIRSAIRDHGGETPYWYYWALAWALYALGHYDDAVAEIQKAKEMPPEMRLLLGVCYARQSEQTQLSDTERSGLRRKAQVEVDKTLKAEPTWRVQNWQRYHWKNLTKKMHWLEGLELAGMTKD